jgi:predicted nuclease of predicted toxin-antitoxin system
MRILLDECLPKDLAKKLAGHEVKTVPQAGWASISNGKLLQLIASSGRFDLFITMDKNIPRQNQILNLPFAIVILRAKSNRLEHIFPFAPEILRRHADFQPGHAYILTDSV